MKRGQWLWFDSIAVVHGSSNSLFAADIAFGYLHRNVPEMELNLLQFSAGYASDREAPTRQIHQTNLPAEIPAAATHRSIVV